MKTFVAAYKWDSETSFVLEKLQSDDVIEVLKSVVERQGLQDSILEKFLESKVNIFINYNSVINYLLKIGFDVKIMEV